MNSISKYGFSQLIKISSFMRREPGVLKIFNKCNLDNKNPYIDLKKYLSTLHSGDILELIVLLIIFLNTKQDNNSNNVKLINVLLKEVQ